MTIDYKKEYSKRVFENLSEVIKEIDSKDMKIKISNWATKFQYSFEEIKQKIITDKIFRCVFIKDPGRQNIYQTLAANYIKSLDIVTNFKTLPSGGKNALYLTNGKIFTGKILGKQAKETKSIDFKWETNGTLFYASHKYTGEDGGAQDNQYEDIQKYIKHTADCNEKNTVFLAICDGDFYLKKDSKTGDKTRLDRLSRLTNNKTSFVLNINQIKEFLENWK